MNKRFHFAESDKRKDWPCTDLFNPVGLFDLHLSDSDSAKEEDRPVSKPGQAAPPVVHMTPCNTPNHGVPVIVKVTILLLFWSLSFLFHLCEFPFNMRS